MRRHIALAAAAGFLTFASSASADEPSTPAAPEPAAPAPAAPAPAAPAAPASVEAPPAPTVSEGVIPPGAKMPGDGQRLVGTVAAAAGFLTFAVGGFLTISAMTIYDEAESRCRKGACSRSDVDDSKLARTRANIGGYVMLSGLALIGGGIALYLTATPRDAPRSPKVGIAPTLGGLAAFGTF